MALFFLNEYHVDLFPVFQIASLSLPLKGFLFPYGSEIQRYYPGEIQSSAHQVWGRMHSCDNHITSCEIMIFNETPLSAETDQGMSSS